MDHASGNHGTNALQWFLMWNAFWSFQPTVKSGLSGIAKALSEEIQMDSLGWTGDKACVCPIFKQWVGRKGSAFGICFLFA